MCIRDRGKPFPAVLEIYAGDFPDALQTVEEGAAVNVQLLCGLQNIAFQLQIDLGGMVQVCFVVIVVFFQEKQFFRAEKLGRDFRPAFFQEIFQQVVVKTVAPVSYTHLDVYKRQSKLNSLEKDALTMLKSVTATSGA